MSLAIHEQITRGKRGAAVAANQKMCYREPVFHERDYSFEPARPKRAPSIPPEFMCPITLEAMTDPVTCRDGQNYERSAIQMYINMVYTRCGQPQWTVPSPVTCENMSTELISNFPLRSLIEGWRGHFGL